MPYFVNHDPNYSRYNAYVDPTRGTGGSDATVVVQHSPGNTTMSVGVGKWLSGDQFYKEAVGSFAENGVSNHIRQL